MTLTCAIYCRISLDATGLLAGVERQEKESRELAARLGLTVGRVFVDNSISAYSGKLRPEFDALIAEGPEVIIAWHIDRLVVLNRDLERVLELQCDVHTVQSGHLDLSNPAGRAVARTIVTWAHYEREHKGERQKAAHRQRRAKGGKWWSTPPFGRTLSGGPVEDEQEVLRWAAEEVVNGLTNMALLARLMNEAGWTGSRGAPWNGSSVRRTLQHERNVHVLGEDLWVEVKEALTPSRDGTQNGPVAMLTGVARCAVCEGPCGGTNEFGRERYKCRRGHVAWPRQVVNDWVGGQVAEVLRANRAVLMQAAPDPSAELHQLALDFAAQRLTAEEFTAAVDRARTRAARAKPQPLADWADMGDLDRRRVCRRLLDSVVLPGRGSGQTPADPQRIALHWRESAVGPTPPLG